VSLSEKKIASQQKQIDALKERMDTMLQTIALMASPLSTGSALSTAMKLNLTSIEDLLLESNINVFRAQDIIFASSIKSIDKLVSYGVNINYAVAGGVRLPGYASGKVILGGKTLDDTQKYSIAILLNNYNGRILSTIDNLEPPGFLNIWRAFCPNTSQTPDTTEYFQPYDLTPLKIATLNGSTELVKFLIEKGATIGDTQYHTPNGLDGDLVAGYLQTHGSKPVIRF